MLSLHPQHLAKGLAVFNWMDDSLKEGGPHTAWWSAETSGNPTEPEQPHLAVLSPEEIRLRAGCPGSPRGEDTAQLRLAPGSRMRERGAGSLPVPTRSTENRPCALEPGAGEI